MTRGFWIAAVFGSALIAAQASANERLPAKVRTILLFKALTFDKGLTKGRDNLTVGVISLKGDAASEGVARETIAQLKKISHMRVQGMGITAHDLAVKAAGPLWKLRREKKINIFYLSPGVEGLLGGICKLARDKKALVLSGEADHSKKCATVTVVKRGKKPLIIINKKAASAQGADFKSKLLDKAEIVD